MGTYGGRYIVRAQDEASLRAKGDERHMSIVALWDARRGKFLQSTEKNEGGKCKKIALHKIVHAFKLSGFF